MAAKSDDLDWSLPEVKPAAGAKPAAPKRAPVALPSRDKDQARAAQKRRDPTMVGGWGDADGDLPLPVVGGGKAAAGAEMRPAPGEEAELDEEADLPLPAEADLPVAVGPAGTGAAGLPAVKTTGAGKAPQSVGAVAPPPQKPPIFRRTGARGAAPAPPEAPADQEAHLPAVLSPAAAADGALDDGFGVLDLGLPAQGGAGSGLGGVGSEADLPEPLEADLPMPAAGTGGPAGLPRAIPDIPGEADLPEPLEADLPEPLEADLPEPLEAGLPSPVEAGLPSPVEAGLPSPVEAGLPSPVAAGLPSPVAAGLPTPLEAGLPVVSPGVDLPTPAEAGLPNVSEGNLPQAADDEVMLPVVEPGRKAPPRRRAKDELPVGDGIAGSAAAGAMLADGTDDAGGIGLDLGPAASEAWDAEPRGEAAEEAATVGDEYDLTEGRGEGLDEEDVGQAGEGADDAPVVQIAPKRSKRLRIALAVCALLIIGGGLLQFVSPWGAFGFYLISDSLNRSEHERMLAAEREKAQTELEADTAAAAQRAFEQAKRARNQMPRFAPMGSYTAYLAFMKSLRFGVEGQEKALGKQLLDTVGAEEPSDMQTLARAAADAVDGQLARAKQTIDGLSQRLPEDIDVAVLAAEVALSAKTAKPALALWKQAVSLKKSARTQYGLARAHLAAGDKEKAKSAARQVLKLSENHAGARTIVASILYQEPTGEDEALKLLQEVTDPKGPVRGAASDDEMVAAYSILGELHLARGRFSAAEEAFAAALKLAPQAMQALVGNGELYYRSGRYSEALARFEAALRVNPDSLEAKIGTAKTWLAQERAKDAKGLMQKAMTAGAKHPLVGYWLGKAEEALGDREKAEAAYRRAIKVGSKDPRVVSAYVALAELLASQAKANQAAEVLAAASEQLPDSPQLHNAKGDVALTAGRLSEAKAEFLAALRLDPDNLGSKFKLGVTLRRGRSFDEAARYFDEVGTTDPEYPGLALERGLLYEETDQTERALEMYAEALKKAPEDLDLKLRVGSTQVISGHAKQAIPLLREVLQQRPNSGEVNHFLGRALLVERTNLAEALRLLKRATEIDPNRAEYFLYLGWAANEAGQPTVAKKALDRALELDRSLGDIYWQRGVLLQKRGATLDALEELRIALEKNPSRYEAYATMALCHQDQSDWTAAEQAWGKAIEGNGEVAEWHYRLGKILFDRGNRAGATAEMRRAVELADTPGKKATPSWLHDAHLVLADTVRATDCKTAARSYQRVLDLAPSDYAYRPDAERALESLKECAGIP